MKAILTLRRNNFDSKNFDVKLIHIIIFNIAEMKDTNMESMGITEVSVS